MSIALMTLARKTALPTNAKFVLMALADWADDNGINCYPSVYELSEYMTCSERTVQRLLRELEEGGWVAVVGNAQGGGSSRQYALNVPQMEMIAAIEYARREAEKERRRRERKSELNPFAKGCQSVTPDKLSPVTTATQGVTTTTLRGDNCDTRGDTGVTPSTIDPPYIHQRSTSVVSADAQTAPPAKPEEKPEAVKAAKPSLPACPHLELLDIFAEQLPELPQPKPELWEGQRAKALASRWKWCLTAKKRNGERYATSKAEALDFFKRYFGYVGKSDFLTGRDGRWSGCDLAWLVKADNFAKVLQGNYENRQQEATT